MLNRMGACVGALAIAGCAVAAAPVAAVSAVSPALATTAVAAGAVDAVSQRALPQGTVSMGATRKPRAVKVFISSNSSKVTLVVKLTGGRKLTRSLAGKVRVKVPASTTVVKARTAGSDVIASRWTKVKVPKKVGGSTGGGSAGGSTAPVTPMPASGVTAEQSAYEGEVFRLTNSARATGRVCGSVSYPAAAALTRVTSLDTAARTHSKDMAVNSFFAHESRNGAQPWDRMTAAGYRWASAGENIAMGYPTPAAVVTGWINSPGHCTNLMSAGFRDIGVGVYKNSSGQWLATQDFGRAR